MEHRIGVRGVEMVVVSNLGSFFQKHRQFNSCSTDSDKSSIKLSDHIGRNVNAMDISKSGTTKALFISELS